MTRAKTFGKTPPGLTKGEQKHIWKEGKERDSVFLGAGKNRSEKKGLFDPFYRGERTVCKKKKGESHSTIPKTRDLPCGKKGYAALSRREEERPSFFLQAKGGEEEIYKACAKKRTEEPTARVR